MPIYQCATSKALSPELKAAIAKEFTRIHVEFTAAPEPFVNVVFSDLTSPAPSARTRHLSTISGRRLRRYGRPLYV
jgi:phenylpyruvate tautomerase PptA (4-oxalocrotonate tautomerase family)